MEDTLVAEKELGNDVSEVREGGMDTGSIHSFLNHLNQRRADG